MKKRTVLFLSMTFLLCLGFAGQARAELVRDIVTVHGTAPIPVSGFGIVTDLDGTGDTCVTVDLFKQTAKANGLEFNSSHLPGTVALVTVTGDLPVFEGGGQQYSVAVSALRDATSLEGGYLQACHLFEGVRFSGRGLIAPEGPTAVASGRLTVRDGVLTRGFVHDGVTALKTFDELQVIDTAGQIRLNLHRPNATLTAIIADQINKALSLNSPMDESAAFSETGSASPMARVVDMGQVVVTVPSQFRQSRADFLPFLDRVLNVPVFSNGSPALSAVLYASYMTGTEISISKKIAPIGSGVM